MPRIIFMGTPEFAVPVLDALTRAQHSIVAVFTRMDRPAGRGGKLQPSPVKQFAAARTLPIFQPKSLRGNEEIERLRDLQPDLIVVSAYGLILPREALVIPARGCINTHASLLPRHRGAAPIAAAILAGDAETGITLIQMDEGIDTGPILAQRAIPITRDATTGTLTTQLAKLAAELLTEELPRILAGEVTPRTQDESRATYAKMIVKEQGLIDWNSSAEAIARGVRAFNPWPSAYTFWGGVQIKILRAEPGLVPQSLLQEPGLVVERGGTFKVMCGRDALVLREIQLAGKRAMKIEDFVRGQRDFIGSVLKNK